MSETVETVEAITREFFEAHTSLEAAIEAADMFFDGSRYISHVSPFPDLSGSEGYKQFVADIYAACPDARFAIEDIIAEESSFQPKVVVRFAMRGMHEGVSTLSGTPTGKQVTVPGISILAFELQYRDGRPRVIESWTNFDFLGLMQQVGTVPLPAQASG